MLFRSLKSPDTLLRALAELIHRRPEIRSRLRGVICGGPSGTGLDRPSALIDLSRELDVEDRISFLAPRSRADLADVYRAANVTMVPSFSESFGLVAVESQACGTPVIAANVGGLRTAVSDAGFLIDGHDAAEYASAIDRLMTEDSLAKAMAFRSVDHASRFSWDETTRRLLGTYELALQGSRSWQQPVSML